MSTPSKLAEYIAEAMPELMETFRAEYEKPRYEKLGTYKGLFRCGRCKSLTDDKGGHSRYHFELSLGFYALGSSVRYIFQHGGEES